MPPITPGPSDIPEDNCAEASSDLGSTVILMSDSDSGNDDENNSYDGYELLSQDPDNISPVDIDEIDCPSDDEFSLPHINGANQQAFQLPDLADELPSPVENNVLEEVIKLDEDRIETIKSVMKGITLPSSNVPEWASLVPEEEWKAALFSEVLNKNSNNKGAFTSKNQKMESENDVLR